MREQHLLVEPGLHARPRERGRRPAASSAAIARPIARSSGLVVRRAAGGAARERHRRLALVGAKAAQREAHLLARRHQRLVVEGELVGAHRAQLAVERVLLEAVGAVALEDRVQRLLGLAHVAVDRLRAVGRIPLEELRAAAGGDRLAAELAHAAPLDD